MSRVCSGKEIAKLVTGLIYAGRETQEHALDLTIKNVFKLTGRGSLDFGGREYASCEGDKIASRKREAGDEYGWWELEEGDYLIEYNENIVLLFYATGRSLRYLHNLKSPHAPQPEPNSPPPQSPGNNV